MWRPSVYSTSDGKTRERKFGLDLATDADRNDPGLASRCYFDHCDGITHIFRPTVLQKMLSYPRLMAGRIHYDTHTSAMDYRVAKSSLLDVGS